MRFGAQQKAQKNSQANKRLVNEKLEAKQQTFLQQNINKIADSSLKFKQLIQSLKRKKYQINSQANSNTKCLINQLTSKNEDNQNTQINKQQNEKTNINININKDKQEDVNEQILQSKRKKKQIHAAALSVGQKKTMQNSNNAFIVNPELIDKKYLNNYCKSIKQPQKSQSMKQEVKYPTISLTQSIFSKISKTNSLQNKLNQRISMIKKIKDIEQTSVRQYCVSSIPLSANSKPEQIYDFFQNISKLNQIQIHNPFIKKYKNCVFYGRQHQQNQKYQGFLFYYQGKIYYGQFLNQQKHGHGVQIDVENNRIWKGEFALGRKTGKFLFKSQQTEYIGNMQNGLYQGEGKLKTKQSTYEGFFDLGLKHGYGQEHFAKTGLSIKGVYEKNNFQKAQIRKIVISSQPQFPKCQKMKQKSVQRVLNNKLKMKLKFVINPELQGNKEQEQQKINQNLKLKLPANYNYINSKQTNKPYLSDRRKKSKQSESGQLDIQNIYLQKIKFKKNSNSFRQRNNRSKRQRKSQLSIIRLNSQQEQIPLVPYFYAANS